MAFAVATRIQDAPDFKKVSGGPNNLDLIQYISADSAFENQTPGAAVHSHAGAGAGSTVLAGSSAATATGTNSVAGGNGASTPANSAVALGQGASVTGATGRGVAIGQGATITGDGRGIAIGQGTTQSNAGDGISICSSTSATPGTNGSVQVGSGGTVANGDQSLAVGLAVSASGAGAVALGSSRGGNTTATNTNTLAAGTFVTVSGLQAIGLGNSLTVDAGGALCVGSSSVAHGTNSVVVGGNAQATAAASQGVALGQSAVAQHLNSVAIGFSASTSADNQIVLGRSSAAVTVSIPGGGPLVFGEGGNIQVGTTTGTQVGTATNQKLGFFGATPVIQQSGSSDVLGSLVTLGLRAASANPPLNLGTGALTAGAGSFTSVTVSGTFSAANFAAGTNPAASGLVRLGNNQSGVVFRNAGNTADLLGMDLDASNQLHVSDTNAVALLVDSGLVQLNKATGTILFLTSIANASTGRIRDTNNSGGYAQRNAANTANITVINVDASDVVQIGNANASGVTANAALTVTGAFVAVGTNPASSGGVRLPNATGILGRNAANNANIEFGRINASNQVEVGVQGNPAVVVAGATGTLAFFGGTPTAKQSLTALTDNSGGTGDDTIAQAGIAYSQADENNMRADFARKINQIRTILLNYGLV